MTVLFQRVLTLAAGETAVSDRQIQRLHTNTQRRLQELGEVLQQAHAVAARLQKVPRPLSAQRRAMPQKKGEK
jgi:hypothetical protein